MSASLFSTTHDDQLFCYRRIGIMKLAFSGSHSTGKSTLLREIETIHGAKHIVTIKDIARGVIKRGFPLEKNSTVDSFVNYIKDQLRAEREIERVDFDLLISDRTVIDAYGYATVNRDLPRPHIPDYFIDMLREVAIREASFYDLFVYFPVEFPMVEDPVRPVDPTYREAVGFAIKDALESFGISHLVVTGDTAHRLESLRLAGVLTI